MTSWDGKTERRNDDRLREIEIQLTRLCSHMESEIGTRARVMADVHKILERYDEILIGNGKEGLITTVSKLVDSKKRNENFLTIAMVAVIGVVVKTFWDLIVKIK